MIGVLQCILISVQRNFPTNIDKNWIYTSRGSSTHLFAYKSFLNSGNKCVSIVFTDLLDSCDIMKTRVP